MRFPHGQKIIVESFELKFKQWRWKKVILTVDLIGLQN